MAIASLLNTNTDMHDGSTNWNKNLLLIDTVARQLTSVTICSSDRVKTKCASHSTVVTGEVC